MHTNRRYATPLKYFLILLFVVALIQSFVNYIFLFKLSHIVVLK